MSSKLLAKCGGMSHNAFGGHDRLDKCDLQGPSLLGDLLVDVTLVQDSIFCELSS